MRSRTARAFVGVAAIGSAVLVLLGGLGESRPREERALAEEALAHSALRAAPVEAGRVVSSSPGVPPRVDAISNRSWRAIAWDAIGLEATRLALGGTLTEARRERILVALSRLRDAARSAERSENDARREVASARRQRAAALEADRVFRQEIGVPLATFLDRVEPGGVEDVG